MGAGERVFRSVYSDFHGRRPISLCQDGGGRLYFGEYFANPQREAVRVFGSDDDGISWRTAYTFPQGSIRHVHGLEFDEYRNGIWVLTGDDRGEAFVAWTADGFNTLEVVADDNQRTRACSGICTPGGFVYGMDAPDEQNSINRIDVVSKNVEEIASIKHSCFFATQACNGYWLSTVVEPSVVNATEKVHVYYSETTAVWREVISVPWDKRSTRIFSYPNVFLAKSPLDSPNVFMSFMGTTEWDGDCVVCRVGQGTCER